jgi:hypothetical protein
MQFAVDENGLKIKAFKNGIAKCPSCNSKVIAKCGNINIDHWAHYKIEDCDSWKYEPITEWHLNWQNHFSKEQIEVSINKNNEVHRADILTSKNVVIEIQNSKISTETIEEREQYYDKMIWVINSEEFKHNLFFKNFPYNIRNMWERIVDPQHSLTGNSFVIDIPYSYNTDLILKALIKCGYERYYDENEISQLVYIKRKRFYNQHLDKEVLNSIISYLIDEAILDTIDEEEDIVFETTFKWKNFRKTWYYSECSKILDLNNGFLLNIISLYENGNGFGKIISKKRFLEKYNKK